LGPCDPSKVRRRCPAIIFAANRIARVRGRIRFLIVSMQTINDIRRGGVPCGTKWAIIWRILLIIPYIKKETHSGMAKVSVIIIWLVLVKNVRE